MNWEGIKDSISKPEFIVGIAAVAVIIIVIIIFASTTTGKKGFLELKDKAIPGIKKSLVSLNLQVSNFKEGNDQIKQQVEENHQKVIDLVTLYFQQFDYMFNGLIEVIGQIPNEKVKAALNTLISKWKDSKLKIKEIVGFSYSEIEEQIASRDREIARLSSELGNIKELLNETLNSKESGQDGAREEGING